MDATLSTMTRARGISNAEADIIASLVDVYTRHRARNATLTRYYAGKVTPAEVNLGLAVPKSMANLSISCPWPRKAVTALQERSRFDSFTASDSDAKQAYDDLVMSTNLAGTYPKAVKSELIHGVVFATVTMGKLGPRIKWHTAESASALWSGENDRISAGMAICDQARYNGDATYKPSLVCIYLPDQTIVLRRDPANITQWTAEHVPHQMGRPLMCTMVHDATFGRPFGRSRITPTVMHLSDAYLRAQLRLEIAAELYTSPQKYLIGADEGLTEQLMQDKWNTYMSSIVAITVGEDGQSVPSFGQLAATSMTPHLEVMRSLAANFSGATNVPINELGVINDNPTSSEAIAAMREPLTIEAETLNNANGPALREVAIMAFAMDNNLTFDTVPPEYRAITPHFRSAAYPSIVSMADGLCKIASADPALASTSAFYELLGFDAATIASIKEQEAAAQTDDLLNQILGSVSTPMLEVSDADLEA